MQSITELFRKVTKPSPILTTDSAPKQLDVQCHEETSKRQEQSVQHQDLSVSQSDNVMTEEMQVFRETVYDLIKDIRDPEKPETLEDLNVVSEDDVIVRQFSDDKLLVQITFVPTVPHCSLASLIGLSLRHKLATCLPEKHKLDIFVKEGTHDTAEEINKQINDKERISAAMENPNLRELVEQCIDDEGGYG